MNKVSPLSKEWLDREDSQCREDRISRLNWLANKMPNANYLTFPGGFITKFLFEEMRYCFVYGQFLAVAVLGLSYMEHTLAAMFYAFGRSDLERANIRTLLKEALNAGWVTQTEFDNLERVCEIRNPITHFRKPSHTDRVEYRAATQNELPHTIIEEDARHVIEIALQLLSKNAV